MVRASGEPEDYLPWVTFAALAVTEASMTLQTIRLRCLGSGPRVDFSAGKVVHAMALPVTCRETGVDRQKIPTLDGLDCTFGADMPMENTPCTGVMEYQVGGQGALASHSAIRSMSGRQRRPLISSTVQ